MLKDILDCEVYLDCLQKLLHQWGVLALLSLPRCTSACWGFLNPRTHGLHCWSSFLSRAELQNWAWPELCCCRSTAEAVQGFLMGAAGRHSLCPWALLSAGHMGSFDGLGLFLLMLAAGGVTLEGSADCLAGLLCTWVVFSSEEFAPC